jgi:hypothetical protein
MSLSHPPTVATWLLQHFRSGPRNDSLMGDLIEEHRRGRSNAWYWRQVLMAILISFYSEIWRHKFVTIRGVITGWTSLVLLSTLFRFGPPISEEVGNLLVFANPAIWGQLHWGYLGWLILFLVFGGSGVITGWFHRRHQTTVVLAFALSWWLAYLPWLCRLAGDTWSDSRYIHSLVNLLTLMILVPASILFGGLWRIPRGSDLPAPKST